MIRMRMTPLVLAAAAAMAAAGCEPAPPTPAPTEAAGEAWPPVEVPLARIVRRPYAIRAGDVLELSYHLDRPDGEVRAGIGDLLEVRFPYDRKLNQSERVQADACVYLDLVGRVKVAGKTLSRVREELKGLYAKFVKDPTITVTLRESSSGSAELAKAAGGAGRTRSVTVAPDGTIALPVVGTLRASGKTAEALRRELESAYVKADLKRVAVSVSVRSARPLRVYVLGEVRRPGLLLSPAPPVTGPHELTLLQAIAQAGSYLPGRADLSRVLLIRRRHLPRPSAAIVNVHQLLANRERTPRGPLPPDNARYRHDIWLADGDIVYVPTAAVAGRSDYVEYVWVRGAAVVRGCGGGVVVGDAVGEPPAAP